MKDSYRYKGLRKQLIEELQEQGISDERVLKAIDSVPRHLFFPDNAFVEHAYVNKAFPIGQGQTISQPFTVAYQTELLDVQKGDKVLEIGTGSGYQAAVLAEMGAKVYSVERQKKLYERTKKMLSKVGYSSIKCFFGDGTEGLPAYAPYSRIIVTAAAGEVPDPLKEQLAKGGKLVIPVGDDASQKMILITKDEQGNLSEEAYERFMFVPLLKGKNW